MLKTILIDDEEQSHQVLRRLLAVGHPEVELIAAGYNVAQGAELLKKYKPDLVFLDVEMPDGLGFDLLRQVDHENIHVIFITAHADYAITAIRFGAVDYLLKPINRTELEKALERVSKESQKGISKDQLDILMETFRNLKETKLPSRIGISTSEGIIFKPIHSILRLEAQQNYTKFIFSEGHKSILASVNIGEYQEQFLPYKEFMRVHRSHIINLNFVEKYVKTDGGYIVQSDGAQIPVSKRYRDDLLDKLRNM